MSAGLLALNTSAGSAMARTLVALLFAVAAAYAGYCAARRLARYGVPSDTWRHILAVTDAGAIAAIAISQLAGSIATAPTCELK